MVNLKEIISGVLDSHTSFTKDRSWFIRCVSAYVHWVMMFPIVFCFMLWLQDTDFDEDNWMHQAVLMLLIVCIAGPQFVTYVVACLHFVTMLL